MELEDLKTAWEATPAPVENPLTPAMIDEVTQARYRSSFKRIAFPELAGVAVCISGVMFIALHLHTLHTAFLQGTGVLGIGLLLAVSTISLLSIRQLGTPANVSMPHTILLKKFAIQRRSFLRLQKANLLLSYVLLVITIVLLSGFFSGKDITHSRSFWVFSLCGGYIFLLFYSRWVAKYYHTALQHTETLLQELQQS